MGNFSIVVDTGGSGDYVSLNSADASYFGATGFDFVTNTDTSLVTCKCTDGNPDTVAVDTNGYTTNATYTVTAITVDPSYRHSGVHPGSGNVYRLENNTTSIMWLRTLTNTVVTGITMKATCTPGTSGVYGLFSSCPGTLFESVIVDLTNAGDSSYGMTITLGADCIAQNCIVGHATGSASYCYTQLANNDFTLRNCLAHNSSAGFFENGSGDMILKNCVMWDCTLPHTGVFTSSEYNADNTYGTGPGTNPINLTSYSASQVFTDESSDDFSLVNTGSPLYKAGVNLYGSGVTTDCVGDARLSTGNFDVGPHELTPALTDDYMVLGGISMNLTQLQAEVRRVIGRNDESINANITQALNRALREWATEFPWEGLTEIAELTHWGGPILTFPRRVRRVIWIADKTNKRAIAPGSRQWDREAPYNYLSDTTGRALQWEPAGISPIWTNISGPISLYSTYSGDQRNVCVTGVAYHQGGSGSLLKTIEVTSTVTMAGETGVTLPNLYYLSLSMISTDAYGTSPLREIQIRCNGEEVVGVIGPYDMSPQHQRVRFVEIPAADTVFRYGAFLEPTPLIDSYQTVPPTVDIDYLVWFASSDLLWQTREGDRSNYARSMAKQIADTRREREQMFGDSNALLVPEDMS